MEWDKCLQKHTLLRTKELLVLENTSKDLLFWLWGLDIHVFKFQQYLRLVRENWYKQLFETMKDLDCIAVLHSQHASKSCTEFCSSLLALVSPGNWAEKLTLLFYSSSPLEVWISKWWLWDLRQTKKSDGQLKKLHIPELIIVTLKFLVQAGREIYLCTSKSCLV